jgi:Zn finger protein HypA/HybF involved in hydrogenase expression
MSPAWTITCPQCGHVGDDETFEMSLADECFCPRCNERFEIDTSFPDDDDEVEEEGGPA